MLIQSTLPLWFADQKKSAKCIIHLEQLWWLYGACAATRFGTLKSKLYTGSVRSSTTYLFLSSSQNNMPLFFWTGTRAADSQGTDHQLSVWKCKWESNAGILLGGKSEYNNRFYSKKHEHKMWNPWAQGKLNLLLFAWPRLDSFFQFWKKILIQSWETPLVGLRPVNGSANACGSCPDKNTFKKQGSFSDLLSMKLAILAFLPASALRLPPPSSQGWCVQRPGRAALWLKEGHILHLIMELSAATQPSLSSRQLSIISPAAHHHHLVSSLNLIHQNSSNL